MRSRLPNLVAGAVCALTFLITVAVMSSAGPRVLDEAEAAKWTGAVPCDSNTNCVHKVPCKDNGSGNCEAKYYKCNKSGSLTKLCSESAGSLSCSGGGVCTSDNEDNCPNQCDS
jgi:hypothetical protein